MADKQAEKYSTQLKYGLGFFGVVVTPQVIAMCTNESAYNFYTDTAIGIIPNIVTINVGPVLLAFLMWSTCAYLQAEMDAGVKVQGRRPT